MKQRPQVSPPPPRRGGGRSLFPIVALISLALLALTVMPAIAQIPPPPPPPPPSHTVHHWIVGPAPSIAVGLANHYVRCGEVVAIYMTTVAPDLDYCDAAGSCPGFNGQDQNPVHFVSWSDGGAGGEFGTYDAQSQWVPMGDDCPANDVTHYKAGDTPGTGELTAMIDDEPEDGVAGSNADDVSVITATPHFAFTVYEFDITDTPTDWEPKGGSEDNSTTYTARIRPTTDHNGASMAKIITFTLSSSSEPGYCLNAGEESSSDLAFESQSGFTISSGIVAATTSVLTSATITVSCYDYGAYGTIGATIAKPGGTNDVCARLLRGTTIYENAFGARVPYDYDYENVEAGLPSSTNRIWDAWQNGLGAMAGATADVDYTPTGDGTLGDGASTYEEYRGFIIADAHVRTDPAEKDMFIWALGGLGCFPANLGLQAHALTADDYALLGEVTELNFNYGTAHNRIVYGAYTEIVEGVLAPGLLCNDEGMGYYLWEGCTLISVDRQWVELAMEDAWPNAIEEQSDKLINSILGRHLGASIINGGHMEPTTSCLLCEPELEWEDYPTVFCANHQEFRLVPEE